MVRADIVILVQEDGLLAPGVTELRWCGRLLALTSPPWRPTCPLPWGAGVSEDGDPGPACMGGIEFDPS